MAKQYIKENAKERERLKALVSKITDQQLKLIIYKEGWTIAVALAHLAFWDERRRVLLRKWKQKGVKPSLLIDEDIDIYNDALIPFLLAIPPGKAAELAVLTADTLDKELEELSPEMIKAIEALEKPYALNRGIHRQIHLDEIDAFLKAKRRRK